MRQDPASVLDERALVAAMLRQEAALAHAQKQQARQMKEAA